MLLSINAVPSFALAQLPCAYALAMRAVPVAVAQSSQATATNMVESFTTVVGSKPRGVVASMKHRFPHSAGLSRGFAAQAAGAVPTQDAPSAVPESTTAAPGVVRKMGPQGESHAYDTGYVSPHPGMLKGSGGPHKGEDGALEKESFMEHPVYDMRYLESIKPTHLPPKNLADHIGLAGVRLLRRSFDLATGYGPNMTEAKWVQRMIFLETVAGVPGMVAGMLRHLRSLRAMKRDQGWIHCLLEEAENERMHLLTFFELRQPSWLFRAMVIAAQGVFFNFYFIAYLLWPKACHSFVGYLEEEAVRTYTHALADIDSGKLWPNTPAPRIAQGYWGLKPNATMRDLILAVRADEACHSHVNHTLKELAPTDANPFAMGRSQLQ